MDVNGECIETQEIKCPEGFLMVDGDCTKIDNSEDVTVHAFDFEV